MTIFLMFLKAFMLKYRLRFYWDSAHACYVSV